MPRMSRVSLFAIVTCLLPVAVAAQTTPPPPPPPPMSPPPSAPTPTPAAAPVAPSALSVMVAPVTVAPEAIQEALDAARASRVDQADIQEAAREAAQAARDQAQAARDQAQAARESLRMMDFSAMTPMAFAYAGDQDYMPSIYRGSTTDSIYNSGLSLLMQHQYENAINRFDRVIQAKSTHADGALYYKAWALSKLGRSDEAVTAIDELKKSYPSSPYLSEARALEANVKQLGPNQVDDDDLKLLAIQAIQYSDPDKAVSTCQGVLNGTNSLAVKRRAIYVLALIDRPEAHELLLSYAKGKGNPELQREAIAYLGARNAKQPTKSSELIDIYNSTSDVDVKMAVISAFRAAGDKGSLISIASGRGFAGGRGATPAAPTTLEARGLQLRAISNLSDLATPEELWPLYQKEENKDLRSEWVSTFSSMGAIDQLSQIVKTEQDPTVRQRAIRALGNQKSDRTSAMLTDLYASGDKDTKTAVITALGNQNNADALIALAKKETDRDLRYQMARELLSQAQRGNKAAADYLADIIK